MSLAQEGDVGRVGQIALERVEEPEGRVGRVVEALVRALGNMFGDEAVAHVAREGAQDPARLPVAAREQAQALGARSSCRVPSP